MAKDVVYTKQNEACVRAFAIVGRKQRQASKHCLTLHVATNT